MVGRKKGGGWWWCGLQKEGGEGKAREKAQMTYMGNGWQHVRGRARVQGLGTGKDGKGRSG